MTSTRKRIVVGCFGLLLPAGFVLAGEASFTSMGFLFGGAESRAHSITPDGQAVAGWGMTPEGFRAFRWTPTGGLENLGLLPNSERSSAGFISDDGTRIAGRSLVGCCTTYSTLWTAAGPQYLGPNLGGQDGNDHALGISGDGLVVVGQAATLIPDTDAGYHPYRWTEQTGMVTLVSEGEEAMTYGAANDVNADGSVIVGWYRQPGMPTQSAFRWTEGGGIVPIGSLAPNGQSRARAVSPDGAVIVGDASGGGMGRTAFQWRAETGMVNYGNFLLTGATQNTVPMTVNAEGTRMAGYYMLWTGTWTHIAFIWDEVNGFRELQQVLADDYDIHLFGWLLNEVQDMSPDGRFLVGHGVNPFGQTEGWIIELPVDAPPPPCPGDLTGNGNVGVPDLLAMLACWGPATPGGECEGADLTASGAVGVPDLLQLLANWGPCPR